MIAAMRRRLFLALGLSCSMAPNLACSGAEGDLQATAVDDEANRPIRLPDPGRKTTKNWVPESWTKYSHGGDCASGTFCSNAPELTVANYGEPCGEVAKIPEGVGADGIQITTAGYNAHVTGVERSKDSDACCYSYLRGACGKGRPMRNDGELVIADERVGGGWTALDASAIADDIRAHASHADIARFTDHLRRVALLEHASVAAFSRVSLELMAFGAPADLVAAAHVAALDEVRHARLSWSLLEALEGMPRGPGPMAIPPIVVDREQALVSTIVDGCIGETVGSLLLEEAARLCVVPTLAAMYRAIADEEADHAALAFRIVRFLQEQAPGDPVSIARTHVFEADAVEPLTDLGILGAESERAIQENALSELVLPILEKLGAPSGTECKMDAAHVF